MATMTIRVGFKDDDGYIDEWRDCDFIPREGEIVYIGTPKSNWRIVGIMWERKDSVLAIVWPDTPYNYQDMVQRHMGNR